MPKFNSLKYPNHTNYAVSAAKFSRLLLTYVLCVLTLSGLLACGQKGALYLPDTNQSNTIQTNEHIKKIDNNDTSQQENNE